METAEFKRRGRLVHNQYLAVLNTVCARPALADQSLATGNRASGRSDDRLVRRLVLLTLYPVTYSLAGEKFFGAPPAQHCERGEHASVRASRGGDGH